MNKKIMINITEDGETKIETEEYKGEMCVDAIKQLLEDIAEVDDFEYKPEYYEKDNQLNMYVKGE